MISAEEGATNDLFQYEAPRPILRKGQIHIGTSGYMFKDWQGPFYPRGLPQRRWLEFYARHFTVAEINATYYRILPASSFEGMVRATPKEFLFWVKLHSDATHSLRYPENSVNQLLDSVKPLIESDKLGGLLAQFPPSFRFNKKSIDYLLRLQNLAGKTPLAVEFRSDDWCNDTLYNLLSDKKLIFVTADLPELPGLPKVVIKTTAAVSYARLHGHNSVTWYDRSLGDRYDYYYTGSELKQWMRSIYSMDEMAPLTFLFFNNCHAGQAVKNARMLRQMLQKEIAEDI